MMRVRFATILRFEIAMEPLPCILQLGNGNNSLLLCKTLEI